MSFKKTTLWLLLVAIGVASHGVFGQAEDIQVTTPRVGIPWGIDFSVRTETLPAKAGPAAFRLTIDRWDDDEACDSIVIEVSNKQGIAYTGPDRWVIPANEATPYTYVVNVIIPDNDTSAVMITASCHSTIKEYRWFVTTGDTLEMYAGRPVDSRKYIPSWSDLERAKFTPGQLQKEFDFILDLRQSHRNERSFAEKLLGTMQVTDTANVYRVRTTIDNWITLWGDWRLKIIPVDTEALNAEFPRAPKDALPDTSEASDTSKPQGVLDNDPNLRGTGAITLERVTGLSGANTLPINQAITYYLRLYNNTGYSAEGITNGFRVYSPDGATWSGISGDTLGTNLS